MQNHRESLKDLKKQIDILEQQLLKADENLMTEALKVPNLTHPSVPSGKEGKVLKQSDLPSFSYEIKDHLEIGKEFDLFDFENAAKITGSKFVYLKGEAAMIELGLINWAMQKVREKGYRPVITPDLARVELVKNCGFQPRDPADQMYLLENGNLCLVATSEIALAGLQSESTISESLLPIKHGGFSHCFRMEAGRGVSSKGLYRLHQFSKVEMFAFSTPADSEKIHQQMLELQIEMIEELGFAYRVIDMPSLDLGASAYRKYDIEIWIPSRKDWGEVTSTSNCTDYQAIRLNAFYKSKEEKLHLHTINGTACAVPRVLIGLLEYGQIPNGDIILPKVLHKYLGFEKLSKNK